MISCKIFDDVTVVSCTLMSRKNGSFSFSNAISHKIQHFPFQTHFCLHSDQLFVYNFIFADTYDDIAELFDVDEGHQRVDEEDLEDEEEDLLT